MLAQLEKQTLEEYISRSTSHRLPARHRRRWSRIRDFALLRNDSMLPCLPKARASMRQLLICALLLTLFATLGLYQSRSPGAPLPTWQKGWRNGDADNASYALGGDTDVAAYDLEETGSASELVSLTTWTGAYFRITFGEQIGYNPNIIPHPTKLGKYVVVGRLRWTKGDLRQEMVCEASFKKGVLVCDDLIRWLEVPYLQEGNCTGPDAWINGHSGTGRQGNQGPRDARVFYGPEAPYILFNALSGLTCMGMWLQDARSVLQPLQRGVPVSPPFKDLVEVARPPPYHTSEKNYFLFWDSNDKVHVQQDIWPARTFTELLPDGSVGEDLAQYTAEADKQCMDTYMPTLATDREFIHQATNAVSVTLCSRNATDCEISDDNTFIMHIFHHNDISHHIYDPYVVLFRRSAPFALHAISRHPLLYRGRSQPHVAAARELQPGNLPGFQSQFFYTTSMTWKNHGQRWHGYIDDPLFLGFGIHDHGAGAIDVLAGDLLRDLAMC